MGGKQRSTPLGNGCSIALTQGQQHITTAQNVNHITVPNKQDAAPNGASRLCCCHAHSLLQVVCVTQCTLPVPLTVPHNAGHCALRVTSLSKRWQEAGRSITLRPQVTPGRRAECNALWSKRSCNCQAGAVSGQHTCSLNKTRQGLWWWLGPGPPMDFIGSVSRKSYTLIQLCCPKGNT